MKARRRSLSVVAVILGGAAALISSTQTWLEVLLRSGSDDRLEVAGAAALPLLAPLSLAALALGLALSIVGTVLRYVFATMGIVIGGALVFGAASILVARPLSAVSAAVTTATGLSGDAALAELVMQLDATAWPVVAAVGGVLVIAGGVLTLFTAHRWGRGGRRYQRDSLVATPSGSRPHDAIDSWDELSRGDDPTSR